VRMKIRTVWLLVIACVLLFGCTAEDVDVFEEMEKEVEPAPAVENLDGWHKVDALSLNYYASNDWAEIVSDEDPNWKTVEYPLSNDQYYTISVSEYSTEEEDTEIIAARVAEDLEFEYEAEKLLQNYQIQVKDWSNGSYTGKMITYCTKYDEDFYTGYLEGYRDIIQKDTSYSKILILLSEGRAYEFRITAYRDTQEAFDAFDKLTTSVGMP